MGKEQPITFLLITDASLHLLGVEILAYRESRGSEIQRPEWLQQFAGQDSNTTLKVGAQIRNISGATISTNAVTEGVNRLLVLLRLLTTQKLLPF